MTLSDTTLIPRLRRMVNEPTTTTYSDATLEAYITSYPINDSSHKEPTWSDWTPTYDLNAAAQDIWEEKASAVAPQHDFSADGSSFSVAQVYEHCMAQARYYGSRRKAKVFKVVKRPPEPSRLRRVVPDDPTEELNPIDPYAGNVEGTTFYEEYLP